MRPLFIYGGPRPNKIINKSMSQLISENYPLAPLTTWRIGGVAARLRRWWTWRTFGG